MPISRSTRSMATFWSIFPRPTPSRRALNERCRQDIPILVGTTGLRQENQQAIEDASKRVAVLRAPNTSLGVNLLRRWLRKRPRGSGPSGTWKSSKCITATRSMPHRERPCCWDRRQRRAEARNCPISPDSIGSARSHAREHGSIGFASLRGGSVAGDHVVIFATDGERIELGHRADSRMIFARGALAGARFLVGKPAGLYSMQDVIGAL